MKKAMSSAREGKVGWTCPSNIALVKYWGKKANQLPQNPSLSLTLSKACTTTGIKYSYDPGQSPRDLVFRFEGSKKEAFQERIRSYLENIAPFLPFLKHCSLEIDSENSFPHSSGIASSASAMGALALCLVNMEEEISGRLTNNFSQKASFLARLGSGSASRSIYPGFVLWGSSPQWPGSSDEYAIPIPEIEKGYKDIRDSILIVESGQKQVSSSAGHRVMETNPFAEARFKQAFSNLEKLSVILKLPDWAGFFALVEEEALSLHAMMMTGQPGYVLMKNGTLEIIRKVREYRKDTSLHLGFTLDAGANVHLLYDAAHEEKVKQFIASDLLAYCENGQVIHDGIGRGPKKLDI